LIFDILSWTIPALISALAQNFWYFLAAGIVNSVWRITQIAWNCLLVEDAEPDQLADIFTWIYIANILVGFIAPLAGLLISTFSLIPTMRGLYLFAAFMFTLKAIVTYLATEETAQGKVRLHETRGQSMFHVLREYKTVLSDLLRTPQTLYTAGIMLMISILRLINDSFWAIIVTEKLQIPAEHIAFFPFIRSAIILVFFFVITPRLNKIHFKVPLVVGLLGLVASQVVLITAPKLGYPSLILSVFLGACGFATAGPLIDKLAVLTISAKERARIQSILSVGIILLTSPFGWIAGTLSEISKDLPFVLNVILCIVGAVLAYVAGSQKSLADEPSGIEVAPNP
jgi:hypothetical protein